VGGLGRPQIAHFGWSARFGLAASACQQFSFLVLVRRFHEAAVRSLY
jgi:hypothetical protein